MHGTCTKNGSPFMQQVSVAQVIAWQVNTNCMEQVIVPDILVNFDNLKLHQL